MKWLGPISQASPLWAAAFQDFKAEGGQKRHQAREGNLSKSGGHILQTDR